MLKQNCDDLRPWLDVCLLLENSVAYLTNCISRHNYRWYLSEEEYSDCSRGMLVMPLRPRQGNDAPLVISHTCVVSISRSDTKTPNSPALGHFPSWLEMDTLNSPTLGRFLLRQGMETPNIPHLDDSLHFGTWKPRIPHTCMIFVVTRLGNHEFPCTCTIFITIGHENLKFPYTYTKTLNFLYMQGFFLERLENLDFSFTFTIYFSTGHGNPKFPTLARLVSRLTWKL
jgi:hypothetical protein